MIYLSAQPDEFYFTWQLELLIDNLDYLKVEKNNIHILVGYDQEMGVSEEFLSLQRKYLAKASFYFYSDKRKTKKYISSIRPNLIKQHYLNNRSLENEVIFYHDSDLLFNRLPYIEDVYTNDINYLSDTRAYLGTEYIINSSSMDVLNEMAGIVGIEPDIIFENDHKAGGAQYILKNLNADFWAKIEENSEQLYLVLEEFNNSANNKKKIQSWCADMWSLLWNLWKFNRSVQIHKELDFSWVSSDIKEWGEKAILHYTGESKSQRYFDKTIFKHYAPWFQSFEDIDHSTCSSIVVEKIQQKKNYLNKQRSVFHSCAIILNENAANNIDNLEVFCKYIHKYIDIEIYCIQECHSLIKKVDFIGEENCVLDFNAISAKYDRIIYFSNLIIIDPSELVSFILKDKLNITRNGRNIEKKLDIFFLKQLSFYLDYELLQHNTEKLEIANTFAKVLLMDGDDFSPFIKGANQHLIDISFSSPIYVL